MKHKYPNSIIYLIVILLLAACQFEDKNNSAGKDDWLRGNDEEKFSLISKHLRGFDMAMAETGYRYSELYWAGKDRNWGYANYQADKIRLAIENGLERRPARAVSAQPFLNEVLPALKNSIQQQDSTLYSENFQKLTDACNSCHAAEGVGFFVVKFPQNRQSPIRLQ